MRISATPSPCCACTYRFQQAAAPRRCLQPPSSDRQDIINEQQLREAAQDAINELQLEVEWLEDAGAGSIRQRLQVHLAYRTRRLRRHQHESQRAPRRPIVLSSQAL